MREQYAMTLISQNACFRRALMAQLALTNAFLVTDFSCVQEALQAQAQHATDLFILEHGPPFSELAALRAISTLPILVLSHKNDPLEEQCDQLIKPFRIKVLLARIYAQLHQFEASDEATFMLGPYQFHPGAKLLMDEEGRSIRLTDKETAILRYLYRHKAQPIAREVLLTQVWGYNSEVTTHTLETHIYRLRQKIEGSNLLVTELGGYRLNL